MDTKEYFLFGAQYYRAPTPASENWESDLRNMKELGFNCVKFWVQWGWVHRNEDEFYFDDIDYLMDLAYKNDLKVTLNVIFDVAPIWIFNKYPDSKIVLSNGKIVEPHSVGHRQIGGFPATCYNHKESFDARMKFLAKTVERYKSHPAMDMWDIWNEPEQCGPYRYAKADELPCFCNNCKEKFKDYLKEKYTNVQSLNAVWGKCYRDFDDVQLPTHSYTFGDFIDYREFHLDTMTNEANCRIRCTKQIDKKHPVYLHVVPNTSSIFNVLTGVDDFEMAKECDIFASTNFAKPIWSVLTTSAGRGKTCYNVECHIGSGSTKMHQKQITLKDIVKDLAPQIGMGIRGFMFWQYRPEVLGHESPAWGVTALDGSMGSVGLAAKEFIGKLRPYLDDIMSSKVPEPQIAIWKGRKNEILNYCINDELGTYANIIENYVNATYYNNFNCRVVNDDQLVNDLNNVKLLIMPACYELDARVAKAVDSFVRNGGTLLCEAHLGAYNADEGRHSYIMPGFGLNEMWGIREEFTTSSYHLKTIVKQEDIDTTDFVDDVKKAIDAYGINGGKNFIIDTSLGFKVTGAERFACLKAENAEVIGTFNDEPCMIKKSCGKGTIYYCGTNLAEGAENDFENFEKFVVHVAESSGAVRNCDSKQSGVHIDYVTDRIVVVNNNSEIAFECELGEGFRPLFSSDSSDKTKHTVPAKSAQIFTI